MINQPNSRTFEFENKASTNEKMLFHIFLFIISRKSPIHFVSLLFNVRQESNKCIHGGKKLLHFSFRCFNSYNTTILYTRYIIPFKRKCRHAVYKAFRLSIELRHNKKKKKNIANISHDHGSFCSVKRQDTKSSQCISSVAQQALDTRF